MPVSHQNNILFVHIPKTAGTSIEYYFDMLNEKSLYKPIADLRIDNIEFAIQHLRIKDYLNTPVLKQYFYDYFKFSVVRNPYHRVLSEYFYVTKKQDFVLQDFRNWLHSYYLVLDTDHKLPQYDFLYINDKLSVDCVLHQETLNKDFNNMLDRLDIHSNKELKQHNKSNNNTVYYNLLSKQDKQFIYNLYRKDFEVFNY